MSIDKRTKEYKESMEKITNPEIVVETLIPESTPDIGAFPNMNGVSEAGRAYFAVKPKPDFTKSENNPGFSLCCKCGEDKLEHNENGSLRTRRQPEACRDCTWEDANKIVCEDGVIRAKEDCKRMTRMVGADEVFYWVKK